jgi:NAD(P)-dependent dehydrogenase (short-subunit alcohol dehydrogenase family)
VVHRFFVYGAAKGGLALYVQGLRNLLHPRGVRVVTFKPGFVDTGMTYGRAGTFLVASPAAAGEAIVRCLERGSDPKFHDVAGVISLIHMLISWISEFRY